MNAETGRVVGSFLDAANVPTEYKEIMAYRLAKDSAFKGAKRPKIGDYVSYMAGVFGVDGYVRQFTPDSEDQKIYDSEEEGEEEGNGEERGHDLQIDSVTRFESINDDQEQYNHGKPAKTSIASEEDYGSDATVEGDSFVPRQHLLNAAEFEDPGQTAVMQFSRELLAAAQQATPVPVAQPHPSNNSGVHSEVDTTEPVSKKLKTGKPPMTQQTLRWPSVKSDVAAEMQDGHELPPSGQGDTSKRSTDIAHPTSNASVPCPKPLQPTPVRAKPVTRGPYRPAGAMNPIDLTGDDEAVAQDLRRSVAALSIEPEVERQSTMARPGKSRMGASTVQKRKRPSQLDANEDDDIQILERIEID